MPRCPTCYRRLASGATCPQDGGQTPDSKVSRPDEGLVAPQLSGYRIHELVGSGGFGRVWHASHPELGESIAIKVGHTGTEQLCLRFAREADALAQIGPPHTPQFYGHGILPDGRPYLVMALLDDPTLAHLLQRLPEPPALTWVRGIGEAILTSLGAVHQHGMIHRDLKPENIFLAGASPTRATLVDFGITKRIRTVAQAEFTTENTILGTPEYIAPEQLAADAAVDARADIYAFGVLLFELLTLRVPFTGDRISIEHGHRTLRPPRPGQFATVPEALQALCLDCLAKDPDRRPQDVVTIRRRLRAGALPTPDPPPRTISVPSPTASAPRLLTGRRQPVVLLAADVAQNGSDVGAPIIRRKGIIARQRGHRLVCAFTGLHDEDPIQAAIVAARELVELHQARVVLHFAELTTRTGRGQSKFYGKPVDQPESWLPAQPWNGLLLTAAIAELLPGERVQSTTQTPGFHCLVAPNTSFQETTTMVGRDALLERIEASMWACITGGTPGLLTIFGEHGIGKSRLAHEIAHMVRTQVPQARVVSLHPVRRAMGAPDATLHHLADQLRALDPDWTGTSATLGVRLLGDGLRQAASAAPLVIIIDDAHYTDDITLDVIEYAALDGEGIRLWAVLLTEPGLQRRRPQWGLRANRYHREQATPLAEDAAMALAAELLRPAEYPPPSVLRRLARWAGGNPSALQALVRTLKRRGAVRARKHGGGWYLVTSELEQLPASPVEQWLVARELDTLSPELAACVRLCAVLGFEFSRDEVVWVQNAAEYTGTATTSIDVDVGLQELAQRQLITHLQADTWAFIKESVPSAVYELVAAGDRQAIHAHALEYWQSQPAAANRERVLASIARHASAAGQRDIAADSYIELGDLERSRHRHINADQYYTSALNGAGEANPRQRARALAGRGAVRYRMQRHQESIDDLQRARQYADTIPDPALCAELLLEEATALDWAQRFRDSSECVEAARPIVENLQNSVLMGRHVAATGRVFFRKGDYVRAVHCFERALRLGEANSDHDTQVVALLLLGPTLVFENRLAEAETHFDRIIALCTRAGDPLHLCVAYNNRPTLWLAKESLENIKDDLDRAVQIAREFGYPHMEFAVAVNLAEFLHWSGDYTDALPLAQRAYVLQRFLPQPVLFSALLVARILAARRNYDAARAMTERGRELIGGDEIEITDQFFLRMLDLILADARGEDTHNDWKALVASAKSKLLGEELLEVIYFGARSAADHQRWHELDDMLADAEAVLREHAFWRAPFAKLASGRPKSDHQN